MTCEATTEATPEVRACTNCPKTFVPNRPQQAFCSPTCKSAFHKLMAKRGQVLMPLAQVWRTSKRGSTEDTSWAFQRMCQLLDMFNVEDREAGRSPLNVVQAKREISWSPGDLGGFD